MLEKILTNVKRRSTVRLMEDALAVLVSQALGGRSIREAAAVCGLADHRLADVLYNRSKRPHPEVLQAIAAGLNVPYEKLALAAYGIIHEAEPVPA
jgi:transcriptional regulator with XRE-family HTH domain